LGSSQEPIAGSPPGSADRNRTDFKLKRRNAS
jgi:hypothetical protein